MHTLPATVTGLWATCFRVLLFRQVEPRRSVLLPVLTLSRRTKRKGGFIWQHRKRPQLNASAYNGPLERAKTRAIYAAIYQRQPQCVVRTQEGYAVGPQDQLGPDSKVVVVVGKPD